MRERPVSLADGGTISFIALWLLKSVLVMPCVRSVGLRPMGFEGCLDMAFIRPERPLVAGGGGPSSRRRGVEENAR